VLNLRIFLLCNGDTWTAHLPKYMVSPVSSGGGGGGESILLWNQNSFVKSMDVLPPPPPFGEGWIAMCQIGASELRADIDHGQRRDAGTVSEARYSESVPIGLYQCNPEQYKI
jgi:hypothetical protein